MDNPTINQSSTFNKISNSSIQFRLLIQSLRNNHKHTQQTPPNSENKHILPIPNQNKEDSIPVAEESKQISLNGNHLFFNQSESTLRAKPRMQVGDRDKLKKKLLFQDTNPQLQQNVSKESFETKLQTSIHIVTPLPKDLGIRHQSSPKIHASTQFQNQQIYIPDQNPIFIRQDAKIGHIIKQHVQKDREVDTKSKLKMKIKDINEDLVLQYLKIQKKVTQKSTPSEIFQFFTNLCLCCKILIKSSSIKKFKNCIYFGYGIQKQQTYQGFLSFYDGKFYYGEFLNGFKHGFGVQINHNQSSIIKGTFNEGHKTGKFYVQKSSEKYIGYLLNGLYDGEGRLTTEDYTYEGFFEKGQKNGYGEQYYSKTGVRITGIFVHGILSKPRSSKSIPEIRNKMSYVPSRDQQRLEGIRKKSVQKHNQKMNKIRQRKQQQMEYEIDFDANEECKDPPKMQFNASKLQMYRQPIYKLPKICQQFEYSFDSRKNLDSLSSQSKGKNEFRRNISRCQEQMKNDSMCEILSTGQLEEPLPNPNLIVLRGRR